jgi:outer membrane protein assembly factor BamE (lipoprotein component of BamABCDE complex)
MSDPVFKSSRKGLAAALILATSLTVSACGNARAVRGYVFDVELADAILPGVDNRQSVQSTLGTPTLAATFDDGTWYYISTIVRIRPVFWPDPKFHRVMAVRFNEAGVVETVDNYDMSNMANITPVSDKTPTKGRTLNLFQQIFGNVGRFSGQAPVGSGGGQGPNG